MPPGGDGFYYFSVYLLMNGGDWGRFDIEINGEVLCTVDGDKEETPGDEGQGSCSTGTYAMEGW